MKFEQARDKVNEVRFFLNHLQEVYDPMAQTDPEAFRYYFSALLNAAYSVEQCARAEFITDLEKQVKSRQRSQEVWKQHMEKWWESLSSEEKKLWCSLTKENGLRAREVHVERTKITAKYKAAPLTPDTSKASQAYRAFFTLQQAWVFPGVAAFENDLNIPAGISTWGYIKEYWLKENGRQIAEISKEAAALCERFVQHLEKVTA